MSSIKIENLAVLAENPTLLPPTGPTPILMQPILPC